MLLIFFDVANFIAQVVERAVNIVEFFMAWAAVGTTSTIASTSISAVAVPAIGAILKLLFLVKLMFLYNWNLSRSLVACSVWFFCSG